MESRLPVPTDNVYKFAALFGLLLFVFAIGATLYRNQSNNEVAFVAIPELARLRAIAEPTPTELATIAVLQKRLEIIKTDKSFYEWSLGSLMTVGLIVMLLGFYKWEKEVQPVADRTAKAQMEIAELQLEKLRRDVEALRLSAANSMAPNNSPPDAAASEPTPSI